MFWRDHFFDAVNIQVKLVFEVPEEMSFASTFNLSMLSLQMHFTKNMDGKGFFGWPLQPHKTFQEF